MYMYVYVHVHDVDYCAIFISFSSHENASGFYRVSSYFIAKVLCDIIPMRVLPLCIFASVTYFMMGRREREGEREGGREGGRERGREGEREGGREGEREGGREGGRKGGREGGREGERETEKRERERERGEIEGDNSITLNLLMLAITLFSIHACFHVKLVTLKFSVLSHSL